MAHWEVWLFVEGAFSSIEAIATATIVPARHLDSDKNFGSL